MRPALPALASLALLLASGGNAAESGAGLSFSTHFAPSGKPLTTDDVLNLDPSLPNAYLRRWVLSRNVQVRDLTTRRVGKNQVGAHAEGIESSSESWLRPQQGPWYQPLGQFPCAEKAFDPAFATYEGTERVVEDSATLWDRILVSRKPRLSQVLAGIRAPTALQARSRAQRVFMEWLDRADAEWHGRVESEIRKREWHQYGEEARKQGFCSKSGVQARRHTGKEQPEPTPMQEAERSDERVPTTPLVRAPARRWGGYFTVKVDLQVGERSLSGRFLLDPGAPQSTMSPSWLAQQGADPSWMEIPEAPAARARFSIGGADVSGLGKAAWIQGATLSGLPLTLQRFLIFETGELFDVPDYPGTCCSGVLGVDFLRRTVAEFAARSPTELLLWPVAHYQAPAGYTSVEVRETEPPRKPGFEVLCPAGINKQERICSADPVQAMREATDSVILDLPHGRIWYSDADRKIPEPLNRTGITLGYQIIQGGDRVLEVERVGNTAAARRLAHEGLRKGSIITQIDGARPEDLDDWQVQQKLKGIGEKSPAITLAWKAGKKKGGSAGTASVPLNGQSSSHGSAGESP